LLLANVDFEMDFKVVVDSIYSCTLVVSNFASIINDSRSLLSSNLLATYDVRFIMRQTNKIVHSLPKVTSCYAGIHIFI